jgi:class 3 adenylate cyclase/tetratricopeptide (TPR) repeat protein
MQQSGHTSSVRRLAAIMFTDIVGYTSMMSKNEKKALHAIQVVRDILKPLIKKYNGKWQKEIGDGTLSSYSSAVDAVNCALDFQYAFERQDFKVRIGIHVGEVTMTEDDIFGDGVNIASRIEPLAPPGGIYITDRVYEDVSNKPEIKTALVGTRSLKNVERPIQVYALVGEGLPEPPRKPVGNTVEDFFSDLWKSRMPQIVVLYLLIAFMIVQVVQWIINKLMLSPNWFDLTWILLLSLLPSVAFMAYYHGRSGMDKWVRKEKIFVSANFAVSIVIIFFLFQGKDLGATTVEVTVEDEQGNTVQRIVPKNEFIKNIAIFNFENYGDPEESGWLSTGINLAILADLDQDMFFQPKGTESFYDELIGAGVERLDDVDFSLKRRIARDLRMDYVLSGGFDLDESDYQINTQLHEVDNGKLIAEHTFTGRNIFNLVDELTLQVKKDLKMPDTYIESVEDLPVSSILTSNLSAYKDFTLGIESAGYKNDFEGSIAHFRNSLEKEPDFIMSTLNLAVVYMLTNQMKQASEYIEIVMDKIYMLPERDQFFAKSFYYLINEDREKRIKVHEMWIELYPNDVDAYNHLVQIYRNSGQLTKAEEILKEILKIDDNRGNFYVDMASVLLVQGKNEEALSYYKLYAEKYPNQSRSFRLLGDYYFEQGDYVEAEKHYEKSVLLTSDNIESIGQMAVIKERQGAFKEAEKIFDTALEKSKTTGDSMKVYNKMMNYFLGRGQIQTVIELWEQTLTIGVREYPPIVISIFRITRLYWYFLIDQSDQALNIIQNEEGKLSDSFKNITAYGYINYYLYTGDIPKAEAELERIEVYVSKYGSSGYIEKYYEAEILFLKGNYTGALEKYKEFRAVNVFFSKDILDNKIALCYLNLNEPDEAIEVLNERLALNPYQASAHLLLAKLLIDENRKDQARAHLIIANQVWENADEAFQMAREAEDLFAGIEE